MAVIEAQEQEKSPDHIPSALGTPDHRYLGRLWIGGSLVFGVFSLVSAILLAVQQGGDGGLLQNVDRHMAFFTTYRVSLIFLFLIPLILGVAISIVPRQIGAKSLVYPRAALGAFWVWLSGGLLFITAWIIDGGLAPGGDQEAVELSLLSLGLVVVAIFVSAVTLVATIIVSRIQNMSLWQVPMFTWSMLTAGGVWLLTLPVLLGNIVVAWIDLRGPGAAHFGVARNLYSQIDWVFSQPQVFIFALPVLGIFTDILISVKGERMQRYEIIQILIAALSALSFGAYAQAFFYPDVSETPVFVVGAILFALVLLALVGGWMTYSKNRNFNVPHIVSTLGLLIFISAAAVAVLRVMGDLLHFLSNFNTGDEDYQSSLEDFLDPLFDLKNSAIGNSLLHLVVMAGLIGVFAGLYYWSPQILGRKLNPISAVGIGLLGMGGALLWAAGDIINGFLELPESPLAISNFQITDGIKAASILAAVGAALACLALLGIVTEVIRSFPQSAQAVPEPKDDPDQHNPWNAPTLEWAADLDAVGRVENAYALWSSKEAANAEGINEEAQEAAQEVSE